MRKRRLCALLVSSALAAPLAAADWPQWRGAQRDGKSADAGLLQQWPEGGPAVTWKASGLGAGLSSVSVASGRVFTMGDAADGQYVLALSERDGKLLWKKRVGAIHEDDFPGPRSTPTIDGNRLYAVTTEGGVVCLDSETGEERWRRSLPGDFGGVLMQAMGTTDWRFSESPLVDGDRVVVTPGQRDALLVALDKATGQELWRTPGRDLGSRGADGAAYASAVVSEAAGKRQYVQLIGRGLIGVDAATGKLLWSYNRIASDIANIATPLVHGNHVFGSVGYGSGSALLEIGPGGEAGLQAREVYFLPADTLQNHHGGLILHEGTVYTGTGHNKGFPIAVDFATGKVVWGPERNEGKASAAVSYADGRLYFRYQDGRMLLIEASPEGYKESGSFMIPDVVRESWSHPVIANGKLFLREQDALWCHDVTAPKAQ